MYQHIIQNKIFFFCLNKNEISDTRISHMFSASNKHKQSSTSRFITKYLNKSSLPNKSPYKLPKTIL